MPEKQNFKREKVHMLQQGKGWVENRFPFRTSNIQFCFPVNEGVKTQVQKKRTQVLYW